VLADQVAAGKTETREAYFQRVGSIQTPVYARLALSPGDRVAGPALIDAPDTTIVVPPTWNAAVDRFHNVIVER
jgi:N-methylhydantoinase A/oxoprolinase/acetone carboxylase beta subunit